MLLAADVGASKTDLAVFSVEAGPRAPIAQARYASADYPSLDAIVRKFLRDCLTSTDGPVEMACFAVCGPVLGDRAQLTYLPWVIEGNALTQALGLRLVLLLNDLEAIAYAVHLLGPDDLHTLNVGTPREHGAIAVIAPGTALGEAFLTWNGAGYSAHPSEGGRADFAPASEAEIALLRYLRMRVGRVDVGSVCSGIGIPNIYEYLRESSSAAESPEVAMRLAQAADRTRFIVETGLDASVPSPVCTATMEMFVSILGAEAGNLALKVLATGGVYLAGGIPAHVLPLLEEDRFLHAFRRTGRYAELMGDMPLHVITNPRVALLGAASYALEWVRSH